MSAKRSATNKKSPSQRPGSKPAGAQKTSGKSAPAGAGSDRLTQLERLIELMVQKDVV